MFLMTQHLTGRPESERELARIVDLLPLRVRIAMLDGLDRERIIAGAYSDGHGGVCPMLAAHRRGARVTLLEFAATWDAYVHGRTCRPRQATPREVRTLAGMLRRSIERELRTPVAAPAPTSAPLPAAPAVPGSRTPASQAPSAPTGHAPVAHP